MFKAQLREARDMKLISPDEYEELAEEDFNSQSDLHKNRGPYSADYTNTARVRFDPNTGKMFTAFPIPEKK
ncbi:hypothetical protein [Agarivorans gilvus]|uniref:hypothetical protein n=1 Tax=Agarivorans gilvus TaxID=680279 RepID=UPI0018DB56E0|nr:hypothetical protein [Agarivorans gilvus]